MMAKKVFISFDYDNDEILKTFLVGQSKYKDSPFEFYDASVKEHLTGDWKGKARTKIKAADIVIFICGEKTHNATGVGEEVKIAQEEKKPYFLLKGYSDKTCTKPSNCNVGDKVYDWTWENLKALIHGGR